LRGHRGDADEEGRSQKRRRGRRERRGQQGRSTGAERPEYQRSVFQQIAERHDQDEADAIADLGECDDQAGGCISQPDGRCDQSYQRLGVVDIRGRQPAGHGEQRGHPDGYGLCRDVPVHQLRCRISHLTRSNLRQCHARESGHPDWAARAGALVSRFRGNDTSF
jgi:hypothetical protein